MRPLRLGTRNSPLARWQAEWVSARLREHDVEVELVPISTSGDRQQRGPIEAIGMQGVFTKEIQLALLDNRVDLAVHSLKDLPTDPVPGLTLAAVPPRGLVGDALLSREGVKFADLPPGAKIGTGSIRRRAQLWHRRGDLEMLELRGNVDTRLEKLRQGDYDAIVLAEAGLERLGLAEHITERLSPHITLPAVGQGALGLECRVNDDETRHALSLLDDWATHCAVVAERALLQTLRGGCLAPVAAWGRMADDSRLAFDAVVLSTDGRRRLEVELLGDPQEAESLGQQAAQSLLSRGAAEMIESSRATQPEPGHLAPDKTPTDPEVA